MMTNNGAVENVSGRSAATFNDNPDEQVGVSPSRSVPSCGDEYPVASYDPLAIRDEIEARAAFATHRFVETPLNALRMRFDKYARSLSWSAGFATIAVLFLVFINIDPELRAWYADDFVPFAKQKLTLDRDVDGYFRIQAILGGIIFSLIVGWVLWVRYDYQVKKQEILSAAKRDLALHVGNNLQSQLKIFAERISGGAATAGQGAVLILLEKWREAETFLSLADESVAEFSRNLRAAFADKRVFSFLLFVFGAVVSAILLLFALDDLNSAPIEELCIIAFFLLLTNVAVHTFYLYPRAKGLSASVTATVEGLSRDDGQLDRPFGDRLGLTERRREILCADPSPYIAVAHEQHMAQHDGVSLVDVAAGYGVNDVEDTVWDRDIVA